MKEIEELTLFFKELKNSWWKVDKFQVKFGRKLKEEGNGEKERRRKENKKERKEKTGRERKKARWREKLFGREKKMKLWKIFLAKWPRVSSLFFIYTIIYKYKFIKYIVLNSII